MVTVCPPWFDDGCVCMHACGRMLDVDEGQCGPALDDGEDGGSEDDEVLPLQAAGVSGAPLEPDTRCGGVRTRAFEECMWCVFSSCLENL